MLNASKNIPCSRMGAVPTTQHLQDSLQGCYHTASISLKLVRTKSILLCPTRLVSLQRVSVKPLPKKSIERTSSADGSWILNDAEDYISCNDFVRKTGSGDLKSASRLLFLRGYPTPEWLGLIGARFKIDPEFFVRFMHFKPAKDGINNYTLPALPAASWNLLELPVISIGERRAFHGLVNQAEVDVMRKEAKTRMHKHHEHLNGHTGVTAGSSVVREVAIFDHGCFALEQRIWICLQRQITSQPNAVEVSTVGAPWTREFCSIAVRVELMRLFSGNMDRFGPNSQHQGHSRSEHTAAGVSDQRNFPSTSDTLQSQYWTCIAQAQRLGPGTTSQRRRSHSTAQHGIWKISIPRCHGRRRFLRSHRSLQHRHGLHESIQQSHRAKAN